MFERDEERDDEYEALTVKAVEMFQRFMTEAMPLVSALGRARAERLADLRADRQADIHEEETFLRTAAFWERCFLLGLSRGDSEEDAALLAGRALSRRASALNVVLDAMDAVDERGRESDPDPIIPIHYDNPGVPMTADEIVAIRFMADNGKLPTDARLTQSELYDAVRALSKEEQLALGDLLEPFDDEGAGIREILNGA